MILTLEYFFVIINMHKKTNCWGESSMDESFDRKQNKYELEDIFKKSIQTHNGFVADNIIKMLCNVDDYMKSVFCVGIAMDMLKENGLRVDIEYLSEKDQVLDAYFLKK